MSVEYANWGQVALGCFYHAVNNTLKSNLVRDWNMLRVWNEKIFTMCYALSWTIPQQERSIDKQKKLFFLAGGHGGPVMVAPAGSAFYFMNLMCY